MGGMNGLLNLRVGHIITIQVQGVAMGQSAWICKCCPADASARATAGNTGTGTADGGTVAGTGVPTQRDGRSNCRRNQRDHGHKT